MENILGLKKSRALFFMVAPLLVQPAFGVFEPGVGIGLEYTDNARLTRDNKEDDFILLGYVGAKIEEDSGPLSFQATTSLTYENYVDDTFSDQYYYDLNATAAWEMYRERLNWVARDFFTQRLTDSDDRATPNNIENVNIFNFGPAITVPLSRVQKFVINPSFTDYYYEESDTDNQTYSLTADWLVDISATNTVGLGGGVSKTDFEDEDENPNFVANNVHGILSGSVARSEYTVNLGYTHIDRDEFKNRSAPTGSINWIFRLPGRADARIFAASDLTDSSYTALESALDPGRGDIDTVQISGDVFSDNLLRVMYTKRWPTLKAKLWGDLRDLDYKETPQDREVQGVGLKLDYQARALLSSGLYAQYRRTERTEQDRTDKIYVFGAQLGYQLSRKLRTVLDLQYQDKDSTDNFEEFSEFSALVNLVYGFGEMDRKRSARSF